ncbi:MAG: ABC transporter permease [Anaerolineae bacterium]|nr:ABC transporter permease [Anaerolineae bacterium]
MIDRVVFFITHSFNDLRVNKQRTLFALLCIAAGVAAMVSLQTLGVMINDTLTGSLQESNRGDLRIHPESEYAWPGFIESDLEDSFAESAFTRRGVAAMQTWFDENYPGSVVTYRQPLEGAFAGWSAFIPERGTVKSFIWNFLIEADTYPVYGKVRSFDGLTLNEMLQAPTDIVLGENLAEDLEAQVGDTLRLSGASQDFTVRGIVPTDTESGFRNSADGFLAGLFGFYYLDVSAVQFFEDTTPGQASELYVRLGDPSKVDEAQERVEAFKRNAISTDSTTDLREQNAVISDQVDDMVVIMGLVSLLIGGIGIVNTMLVIVSRRTTEIAVLKTLGVQPGEVTLLFLVEAIIMGILGGFLGVLGGWGLAYLTKGVAENFLGQSLVFTPAIAPAVNGYVVGVAITMIFGFLPTLAAGQVRPALVLRPSEAIIPQAGRLSAFVALVALILVLSLVAQGLLGDLLDDVPYIDTITPAIGVVYGVLMALALIAADIIDRRKRRGRPWLGHAVSWLVTLAVLTGGGALVGQAIPALLLVTIAFVVVGYLYVLFWLIIWAAGGGRFREIWPGVLVLLLPALWPLIPVLIVILLPVWALGRLIQRVMFVDFRIAMRGMLATKGRGATTLLALVIGIFTLSVITMLVDTITSAFEDLLNDAAGGDVVVFTSMPSTETITRLRDKLESERDLLDGYAVIASFDGNLSDYRDVSQNRNINIRMYESIDGRDLDSNLPKLTFTQGRNLDPARDNEADTEGYWPVVVQTKDPYSEESLFPYDDVEVGDIMTFQVQSSDTGRRTPVMFKVVGVAEGAGLWAGSDSRLYAPLAAFEGIEPSNVAAVLDVPKSNMRELRVSLMDVPGTFALETRYLNDLVNQIVDQFTSFPILVAALALFTGGFVIANSVALSTMERRREIGVMKAVGLQRERVLGMLLLEHSLTGIIGGLIGVGISFVILALMLYYMFQGELGDRLPYGIALTLMGVCVVISLVAAIASVWTASGEKPLNTLRYE